MNLKFLVLILYAIIGLALIGMGIFKKVQVFEGEKIEKLKQLQIINTLSSIVFGLCFIAEAYFCYLGKLHWIFLLASVILVEVFQQVLFKVYIKSDDENKTEVQTTKLAEDIQLDEILEEDFFDGKKKAEELERKEEIEREQFLKLKIEKEQKEKQVLEELMKEGIELEILKNPSEE